MKEKLNSNEKSYFDKEKEEMMRDPQLRMKLIRGFSPLWIAYNRLKEIKTKSDSGIISFPHVYSKICVSLTLPKEDAKKLLCILYEIGLIEIKAFHGIKIIENALG